MMLHDIALYKLTVDIDSDIGYIIAKCLNGLSCFFLWGLAQSTDTLY